MTNRIAVETLTLSEISDLFQKSLEFAFPKFKGAIAHIESLEYNIEEVKKVLNNNDSTKANHWLHRVLPKHKN